jgi:MFS family permease
MEYWKKAALIGGLGAWSDTMDVVAVFSCIGLAAQEWGVGPALIGLSITLSRAIPVPLHSAFSGILIDLFGRKKFFVLGNFITGIGYICMSLARDIWTWTLFWIPTVWCFWLGGLAAVFVVEELPPEKRAYYYGLTRMLTAVGSISMSASLPIFAAIGIGWRGAIWYNAAFNIFVALLGLIFLKESTVWQERRELIKQGKIPKEERLPLRKVISDREIRTRFLILCWAFFFLAFTRLSDWFGPTYQALTLGFDASLIGYMGILGSVIALIASPIFGRIADSIGRIPTLTVACTATAIFAMLSFATDILVGVGTMTTFTYFIITYVLLRFFNTGKENTWGVWTSEVYPTSLRATLLAWNNFFYTIPDILAPTFIGMLAQAIGSLGYVIPSALGILLMLTAIPLRRKLETVKIKITAE